LKQKARLISLFFAARGFPWRILRRLGCLCPPLVAVDQKANPAYPWFYNGGGSCSGAWPEGLEDVSPPVGCRGKAPVGVLGDEVPQKLKQNVILVYNF